MRASFSLDTRIGCVHKRKLERASYQARFQSFDTARVLCNGGCIVLQPKYDPRGYRLRFPFEPQGS